MERNGAHLVDFLVAISAFTSFNILTLLDWVTESAFPIILNDSHLGMLTQFLPL